MTHPRPTTDPAVVLTDADRADVIGARLAAVVAVHANYFDTDGKPGVDDTTPEPEDVWRYDRDFRAALSTAIVDAAARLRDLTHRLGFGDGITEPMADNDTIVRHLYDEQRDADEWREHQRWLDDCAEAGCDPTHDCPRHAPACHPAHPDADTAARLAAVAGILDRSAAYMRAHGFGYIVADLRAALSAPDAGQVRPNICPTCGTHHVSERVGGHNDAGQREEQEQTWRDRHGDVWREGEDGLLHTPETTPFPLAYVERKWGPLIALDPTGRTDRSPGA